MIVEGIWNVLAGVEPFGGGGNLELRQRNRLNDGSKDER